MKYEENSVLELKEQINADFKKEIVVIPLVQLNANRCVARVWPNFGWGRFAIKMRFLASAGSFVCSVLLNPTGCKAYLAE